MPLAELRVSSRLVLTQVSNVQWPQGVQQLPGCSLKPVSAAVSRSHAPEVRCRRHTSICEESLYFHSWQLESVAACTPEEGGALSAHVEASYLSPALAFH